jgi:hypothetical protein
MGLKSRVRIAGRAATWPVRRFVDPRIAGLLQYLDARFDHINRRMDSLEGAAFGGLDTGAATEATTLMGQTLAELLAHADQTDERLNRMAAALERLEGRASGSESIVEITYALRALARLTSGSKVLAVGGADSTLPLSLAALGTEVVVLDPTPTPLEHPKLRTVEAPLEKWKTDETFDAIVSLAASSLDAGAGAARRLRGMVKPDGLLILAAPLETQSQGNGPTVDGKQLENLLAGWTVEDSAVAGRTNAGSWELRNADGKQLSRGDVLLVTARAV